MADDGAALGAAEVSAADGSARALGAVVTSGLISSMADDGAAIVAASVSVAGGGGSALVRW